MTCCHCGIRFLTHPRNAHRIDLRCPFGCRKAHRKQESNRRSTAYYRTEIGKAKKSRINQRRSQPLPVDECSAAATVRGEDPLRDSSDEGGVAREPSDNESMATSGLTDAQQPVEPSSTRSPSSALRANALPSNDAPVNSAVEMHLGGVLLTQNDVIQSSLLPYLCEVASLLEGRSIVREELIAALLKRMRQHSIGRRARREYVRSYLNQHPP